VNVLFVSNLFPNCHEPARGVFNFHQIRHLAQRCAVQVVAPIAWFPIPGRFAPPAQVPAQEELAGLTVHHPRAFYLPKLGRTLNPWLYAASLRPLVRRLYRAQPFDVIFVNWAYPDACGVARLAKKLNLPFVVSISGSDANWYLTMRFRRRQILAMLAAARAVTVRSRALRDLLTDHGVAPEKIQVIYNGVDRQLFNPPPQAEARRQLQVTGSEPVLLYVGRLSPEKGVTELVKALALLRKVHHQPARLIVVGDGAQREELWQLAIEQGLQDAVTWSGWKKPAEVATYLSAADLVCLPSHMEGVPNAALEAFACGVPVVATRVGGVPEIVTETTGVLTEPQDPKAFAAALSFALQTRWDAAAIRTHAARFDWHANADQVYTILQAAVAA
jgi:glycosyltransferase involved in cell wall biosynthesis